MKDHAFLIVSSRGVQRMTKTRPRLKSGEHAIRLRVEIPDAYFDRSIPTAVLEITEDYIMAPEFDVDVVEPEAL